MPDASELDSWREVEDDLDLTEPVDENYDPLARFQTPVPTWMMLDNGKPCVEMARKIGRQEALEFFFGTHTWQQAKTLCGTCPNQTECVEYANKYGEEGVWGGTTYPERKRSTNQPKENV